MFKPVEVLDLATLQEISGMAQETPWTIHQDLGQKQIEKTLRFILSEDARTGLWSPRHPAAEHSLTVLRQVEAVLGKRNDDATDMDLGVDHDLELMQRIAHRDPSLGANEAELLKDTGLADYSKECLASVLATRDDDECQDAAHKFLEKMKAQQRLEGPGLMAFGLLRANRDDPWGAQAAYMRAVDALANPGSKLMPNPEHHPNRWDVEWPDLFLALLSVATRTNHRTAINVGVAGMMRQFVPEHASYFLNLGRNLIDQGHHRVRPWVDWVDNDRHGTPDFRPLGPEVEVDFRKFMDRQARLIERLKEPIEVEPEGEVN